MLGNLLYADDCKWSSQVIELQGGRNTSVGRRGVDAVDAR